MKRYEYVSFELQTPIVIPANNAYKKKAGYRFIVDNTNESHPFDHYNNLLEINVKLTKMDNTNYGANDNLSLTNGGYGLIEGVGCDFNGVTVVDSKSIHHIVNANNIMAHSKDYTETVVSTQFHYPDTSTHANS